MPKNDMQLMRVFTLGKFDAQKLALGMFKGTLTIDFDLGDTYFLKGVMGAVTDAGAGPYTHTYADATNNAVQSMTVEMGQTLGTTNSLYKYLGVVVDSCTLRGLWICK